MTQNDHIETHGAVYRHLEESAALHAERPALICEERTWTYREFLRHVDALAAMLAAQGMASGERAAVLVSDKASYLIAVYAVARTGGIVVPLPDGEASCTIAQMAAAAAPLLLVTSADDLARHPQLRASVSCPLLLVDPCTGAAERPRATLLEGTRDDGRPPGPAEGGLLLYTAGTNGERKGALLSQGNMVQVARNIIAFTGIDASACEFVAVPLYRSFGLGRTRALLFAGATIVVSNGPLNPVSLVQSVLRHHCNALSFIPSGFASLFGHQESLVRRIGAQIRFIELGSSPMMTSQREHMLELFPNARICLHYGVTEAPRTAFLDLGAERARLDTAGRPAPNVELAVVDTDGEFLPACGTGEIVAAGGHVMLGYWRNEALTAASMLQGRWFRTGDYGFLDEEGYLHIIGRKDGLITMDGVKFSPLEVEERIREVLPSCEFCVIGIPDPAGILGEIPVFCYRSESGKTITASELSRLMADRIDRNKIPRIVYRVDRAGSPGGKLDREQVRRQFLEEFSRPELLQR